MPPRAFPSASGRAFSLSSASSVMATLNTSHRRRAAALAALRAFGRRLRLGASAAAREAFSLRPLRPAGGEWEIWPEAYASGGAAGSSGLPEDEDEPLPLYRQWAEDAECPPPAYAPRPEGPPPSYESSVRQDILGGAAPACPVGPTPCPSPASSPASSPVPVPCPAPPAAVACGPQPPRRHATPPALRGRRHRHLRQPPKLGRAARPESRGA